MNDAQASIIHQSLETLRIIQGHERPKSMWFLTAEKIYVCFIVTNLPRDLTWGFSFIVKIIEHLLNWPFALVVTKSPRMWTYSLGKGTFVWSHNENWYFWTVWKVSLECWIWGAWKQHRDSSVVRPRWSLQKSAQTKIEHGTSLVAQMVKNPPAMQKTQVQSLGREDLLEKEMATQSSILTWKTPGTGEAGELQPMGSQEIRHDLMTKQQQRS